MSFAYLVKAELIQFIDVSQLDLKFVCASQCYYMESHASFAHSVSQNAMSRLIIVLDVTHLSMEKMEMEERPVFMLVRQ